MADRTPAPSLTQTQAHTSTRPHTRLRLGSSARLGSLCRSSLSLSACPSRPSAHQLTSHDPAQREARRGCLAPRPVQEHRLSCPRLSLARRERERAVAATAQPAMREPHGQERWSPEPQAPAAATPPPAPTVCADRRLQSEQMRTGAATAVRYPCRRERMLTPALPSTRLPYGG